MTPFTNRSFARAASLFLLLLLPLGLLLVQPGRVHAQKSVVISVQNDIVLQGPPPTGPPPDDSPVPAVVTPDPEGSAVTSSGAGDGTETTAPPTTVQQIFQTIKNIVTLSRDSLVEAYEGLLEHAVTNRLAPYINQLEDALDSSFRLINDYSIEGMDGVVNGRLVQPTESLWWMMLSVGMAFASLVLVLNILTLVSPQDSPRPFSLSLLTGIAQEIPWFILAGASLWLTNLLINIFWGTAGMVSELPVGGVTNVALKLSNSFMVMLFGIFVPGLNIIVFYVIVGLFFLILVAIAALVLGHMALLVLAMLWIVSAPMVIVIGRLPPFRWVYGMWLRLGGGVLLIPIINAVLYHGIFLLLDSLDGLGALVSAVIALGLIGLLISVNFTIGKLVFGPILQIGAMTHRTVKGIALSVAGAAGLSNTMAGKAAALNRLGNNPGNDHGGQMGAIPGDDGPQLPGGGGGTEGQVKSLQDRASTGQLSRQDLGDARAIMRHSNLVGRELSRRDSVFGGLQRIAAADGESQLDRIEAALPAAGGGEQTGLPGGNGRNNGKSSETVPFDSGKALNIALGTDSDVASPRTQMAEARVDMAFQAMNKRGYLTAVHRSGVDPDAYVGKFVTMSLLGEAREELNARGARLPEYSDAREAFVNAGNNLSGNTLTVHRVLADSLHTHVEGNRSLRAEALEEWIAKGISQK